jgi:hypothetical protein
LQRGMGKEGDNVECTTSANRLASPSWSVEHTLCRRRILLHMRYSAMTLFPPSVVSLVLTLTFKNPMPSLVNPRLPSPSTPIMALGENRSASPTLSFTISRKTRLAALLLALATTFSRWLSSWSLVSDIWSGDSEATAAR